MARLPRLVVAGQAHYLLQRGLDGHPIVRDDEDRRSWLDALREAAAAEQVAVHAYALLPHEAHLLVTPVHAESAGRLMQALGRRHVAVFNRRHGRRGTLFDGRFRGTVVEPGDWLLDAMCRIDALPAVQGPPGAADDALWSSAPHHVGQRRAGWLSDPVALWQLGNTPFERERAYQQRLQRGLAPEREARLAAGAAGGWAVGSAAFVEALAAEAGRPTAPRPRGRPSSGTGNA